MGVLSNLEPGRIFEHFEEIIRIPRETYNTKEISDYCVDFARKLGLEVRQDEMNNVVIKKPGTAGYENSEAIIVQGHLDMVCVSTPDREIDFSKDPIEAYIEDGYVKARGTSLGADNGIAIAMIMTLLESKVIPHPPIEAILTSDEEDGLLGAQAIDMSDITGIKLLNIDGEDEGVLTIGCSGGIRGEAQIPLKREEITGTAIDFHLHGLLGGHSGMEINLQRGNAHMMMGRLIYNLSNAMNVNIVNMTGGAQDNVISHVDRTRIIVAPDDAEAAVKMAEEMEQTWIAEFMGEEPSLKLDITVSENETVSACDKASTENIITFLTLCPNGVIEYSRKLEGLVETSVNIGVIKMSDDMFATQHYLRSAVDTRDEQLWNTMCRCAEVSGGEMVKVTEYLAWPMKIDTSLQLLMMDIYKEMYDADVDIVNMHAGLEPALFFLKKPELECISFGPNIYDVHSVNEKLDIASVGRTWDYILEILRRCR